MHNAHALWMTLGWGVWGTGGGGGMPRLSPRHQRPPPVGGPKTLRRSAPDLAQTWGRRRRKFCLCMRRGVEVRFSSACVSSKCFFLTPDLPHPASPPPQRGCWARTPRRVNVVLFKTPTNGGAHRALCPRSAKGSAVLHRR